MCRLVCSVDGRERATPKSPSVPRQSTVSRILALNENLVTKNACACIYHVVSIFCKGKVLPKLVHMLLCVLYTRINLLVEFLSMEGTGKKYSQYGNIIFPSLNNYLWSTKQSQTQQLNCQILHLLVYSKYVYLIICWGICLPIWLDGHKIIK